MKQRIRVVGIVRTDDGVLVLKRNRGRSETPVFWELPTGKIKFGEQPEESITRSLAEYTGLVVNSVKLKDVIAFLALEGSSRLSNLYIVYEVTVDSLAKPTPTERYTAYKFIKDFSTATVHLNEASLSVIETIESKVIPGRSVSSDMAFAAQVFVDGASRGNPGPSGIGYHIIDSDGSTIEQGGEFIGFATSRVAEYYAMRKGVERAIELGLKAVRFISDSLMVVNQLNGIFTIKNSDVLPIYKDIEEQLGKIDAATFTHIARSGNAVADHEANLAIDRILRRSAPPLRG